MKKIISIALTLIMLLSATSVFAFGAAAAEAPSVPSVQFAQKTAPDANNKQNIRFVSEVPQTVTTEGIDALGYYVVAAFNKEGQEKLVSYTVEGTEVFTSLKATVLGTTNVVEAKADKYFFALTIKDVPTDIGEIYLQVKTYAKVGDVKTFSDNVARFCFVNGEATQTSTYIYADSFDQVTWKQAFHRSWKNDPYLASVDGKLKIDGGWTGWQVVENSAMTGITKYTIETDIAFIGDELGAFQIFFNSNQTFEEMVGVNTLRGNNNILAFRNTNSSTNKFTGTNDTNMATLDKLGCALITMKGTKDSASSKNIIQSASTGDSSKDGTITDKYITNGYTESFKLAIEVDCTEGIVNVYVNGVVFMSMTTDVWQTPGAITIMAQNGLVEMDNFTVKTGAYSGATN